MNPKKAIKNSKGINMKIINYYHDTSYSPQGTCKEKGINLEKNKGPIKGEFLGLINDVEGNNFIIGRTIQAYDNDINYIGKIVVRRVLIEDDGLEKILYLNGEEDRYTHALEKQFSELEKRGTKLTEKNFKIYANKKYNDIIEKDNITAIAISSLVFTWKETLISVTPQQDEEDKTTEMIKY